MSRRRCKGKNKSGKPCGCAPLKGQDWCAAHDPNLPEDDRFGSKFQSARAGASEKPHTPKLMDVLRERVEEHVEAILAPYFKALGVGVDENGEPLKRGAIVAYKGEATDLEDLAGQIDAAERLIDRVYGKSRQAVEHSGPDGGPIELEAPADDTDRATRAALLLRDAGLLKGTGSNGNGHVTNGNGNGHH